MAAESKLKPVQSGMLSANVTIDVPSASCLASCVCLSPSAMTAMPAKIGSHTTMLKIGQLIALLDYGRKTSQPTSAASPTIIANA